MASSGPPTTATAPDVVLVAPEGEPGPRTDALVALVEWLHRCTGSTVAVVWWRSGPAVGPVPGAAVVLDAGGVNEERVPRALAALRLRPLARAWKSRRLRRLLAPLAPCDRVLLGDGSTLAYLDWVPTTGRRRVAWWAADERDPGPADAPGTGPTRANVQVVGAAEALPAAAGHPGGLAVHPGRLAGALGLDVATGHADDVLTVLDTRPAPTSATTGGGAPPAPAAARSGAPTPEPDAAGPEPETIADPLTAALTTIWSELLGRPDVPTDGDFFALGGYSLLAAQMLVLLEQRTGVRLPMAVFLEATTVDQLAAVARATADAEADADADRDADGSHGGTEALLVPLVPGDPEGAPLFLTHDLQGSAFRLRPLAEAAVPEGRAAYGFESPFLEGRRAFATIEAMAGRYVEALRSVQPVGPYHLAGYSFGGVLAFEMARALRAAGEEVALLGIVDVGPGYRGLDYSRTETPPLPFLDAARAEREPGSPWAAWRPEGDLDAAALAAGWERRLAAGEVIAPEERLWFAWWSHWHLVGPQWAPAPYDGRIDLFWAETTEATDDTMGWGATGAEVVVHRIPGRHEDLLRPPSLDAIGAGLRTRLGAAPAPG